MTQRHFRIREVDRRVFDALKDGSKTVETRAGSPKYQNILAGDEALFDCGDDRFSRRIIVVRHFPDIHSLVEHYGMKAVSPWLDSEDEQVKVYHSYPGYAEKIAQFGLVALELE